MTPVVTIIIPVYNAEKYLHRCISSILNQTYPHWVVIFVNDGSTDESLNILESYSRDDKRFKIINKRNGGAASARNAGLDAVQTELFTFVDSDDAIHPEFLSKTINAITTYNCDIVITGLKFRGVEHPAGLSGKFPFSALAFFKHAHRGPCAKLYKKSIVDQLKLHFPENMLIAEDYVFTRLYTLGVKSFFSIPDSLYLYHYDAEDSLIHRFLKLKFPYSVYEGNMEASWRVYIHMLKTHENQPERIADFAYALYRDLWMMYYESYKCIAPENTKKFNSRFRFIHKDFERNVGVFKRITLHQRYPRLYKWAKRTLNALMKKK